MSSPLSIENPLTQGGVKETAASSIGNQQYPRTSTNRMRITSGSLISTAKPTLAAKRARSDLEIIGDILRIASRNGGESISVMRQRANLSQKTITRYLRLMLARNLLSLKRPSDRNSAVLYRPTELGYDFVLRQRELLTLLDSEGPELFSLRDW